MQSWGAAPATIGSRCRAIHAGIQEWGDPLEVTGDQIGAWIATPHFSAWTRVTYFAAATSFFGWLLETGQRPDDPTAKLKRPRTPKGSPRPLTPADAESVIQASDGDVRASLLLAMLTGLRAHEVAKLRGEDIDERQMFVHGKGGKQAFMPTHPVIWDLAQQYPRRGYWFPARNPELGRPHISASTVTARVSRLFRTLGIDGSLHRCRHFYGTELLRAGVNMRIVQKLMRHESLATTALYTAVDEDEMARAVRGLHIRHLA